MREETAVVTSKSLTKSRPAVDIKREMKELVAGDGCGGGCD